MGDNSKLEQLHDLQSLLKNKMNEYRNDYSGNIQMNLSHPENTKQVIRVGSPFEKIKR